MDSYDSDSSGIEDEELGDYTDTGVLLGYAAEEVVEDSISHLGGWPEWLDPATPPPGNFAKCKVCNTPMPLLLQLDAGIPDHFPYDERRLYIFGCTKRPCNRKPGNIRALRGVIKSKIVDPQQLQQEKEKKKALENKQKEQEKFQPKPKHDIGADLFGVSSSSSPSSTNANPFSTKPSPPSASAQTNPFASMPSPPSSLAAIPPQKPVETETAQEETKTLPESFADKVRLSSPAPSTKKPAPAGPPEPWPEQSAFQKPYTLYHLDAEYETLSQPSTPTVPSGVQIEPLENETEPSSSGKAGDQEKDTFESALDKSFLRFSTRLEHNPEQVLRYEFMGSPLLYSTADQVGKIFSGNESNGKVSTTTNGGSRIPRCESCGAERVFELQLVPHAIAVLEEGREGIGLGPKDDPGMEWGTLIVGVCSANCGSDQEGVADWREEWVGVQWEERISGP